MVGLLRRPAWLYVIAFASITIAPRETSAEAPLYRMQDGHVSEIYWSNVRLEPNAETRAIQIDGSGVINRFWCTIIPKDAKTNDYLCRAIVINLYWDGSDKPAVSVPLADFFCQPLHLQPIENRFFSASNALCVFNAILPMPFRQGFRLELENGTNEKLQFWYGLDVERRPMDDRDLYLHAYWNRVPRATASDELAVLPRITGKGRYLGTHFALRQKAPDDKWRWYSRQVRIQRDLEPAASPSALIGTLDDFVCSGWWSLENPRRANSGPFSGRPLVQIEADGSLAVAFYRYHVEDPLWFQKSFAITVGPHISHSREKEPAVAEGDWSITSFFYLDKPTNSLPPILDAKARTAGL